MPLDILSYGIQGSGVIAAVAFCVVLLYVGRPYIDNALKRVGIDRRRNLLEAGNKVKMVSTNVKPAICIADILELAARTPGSIVFHPQGRAREPYLVSYRELRQLADDNARRLKALPGWKPGRVCLVCLEEHFSNLRWFWAVVLAGGIPALCPSIGSGDVLERLKSMCAVLNDPICLLTQKCISSMTEPTDDIQLYAFERLESVPAPCPAATKSPAFDHRPVVQHPTSMIMLTSGSSGNAKAVPLKHNQIFACLRCKAYGLPLEPGEKILNWVGMDHVAGILEAHIRPLSVGADQVHVDAADIMANPPLFLELLHEHKAKTTFAPNFLLAQLVDGVDSGLYHLPSTLSFAHLRALASGGEGCTADIFQRSTDLFRKYGAQGNVVFPAFGMTETGAGCIFNRAGPAYDKQRKYEFASVGKCMPGVEMRISSADSDGNVSPAVEDEKCIVGNVELRGPVVFDGYLNNPEANMLSFTQDGWFRTGDLGFIDIRGNLVLTGRAKEVVCINGIKHFSVDLETAIRNAVIPGVVPDYIACFPCRSANDATEKCCVVYQHSFASEDKEARLTAQKLISKAILLNIGANPHILPVKPGILEKTTLGKLSRAKIKAAFEKGHFADEEDYNSAMLQGEPTTNGRDPANEHEAKVLEIICSTLSLSPEIMGVEVDFFDVGITSVDLIRLKNQICQRFNLPDLSLKTMITNSSVRSLANAITGESLAKQKQYQAVIQLQNNGSKTPLWFVHPGVGEVLVFLGLAQKFQDRPVYALRARGFEEDERPFRNISEMVSTYVRAIKSRQPKGPYLIAGYSYGSMVAFEIAKRLEAMDENVPFLGCFNLPPHIKTRMQQLNWQACLVHLNLFLGSITQIQSDQLEKTTIGLSHDEAMDVLLAEADLSRLAALGISREGLARWADVAFALQSMAVEYEPTGRAQNMDVFYCEPLTIAARSKREWLEEQLYKWRDFCFTPPKYHSVNGAHYTMLSSEHVDSFFEFFQKALEDRFPEEY